MILSKQNKVDLFNCKPEDYAYYRGINYGLSSKFKMYFGGDNKMHDANTLTGIGKAGSNNYYCWNNSETMIPVPTQLYIYSEHELNVSTDYLHINGLSHYGEGSVTSLITYQLSPDKHHIKVVLPNYVYAIRNIWIVSDSFNYEISLICYNELNHLNPREWLVSVLRKMSPTKSGTLTLGHVWLSLLTDEDKKIATDKGWTLA